MGLDLNLVLWVVSELCLMLLMVGLVMLFFGMGLFSKKVKQIQANLKQVYLRRQKHNHNRSAPCAASCCHMGD